MLLTYGERGYDLRPGESVLEGMARHGVSLPSACQAGACQTCLVRAVAGDPGEAAQRGLKATLRARGYFLACVSRPADDLTIATAGPDAVIPATLARREWFTPDVMSVWLRPERPLEFQAGQHLTVTREGGVTRCYSLANLPWEAARDGLALHVRVYPGGAMSQWLADAPAGARVGLGVPTGNCFYLPDQPSRALLLAGAGTGVAPLLAIAREAVSHGHRGPVTVICAAARPDRLYVGETAPAWAECATSPEVRWRTAIRSRGEELPDVAVRELSGLDRSATRAYLCGGRASVAATRRALFLAGLSARDIYADEFAVAVGPR